jgi:glycosyltransferase involved in cell wall biosynthesis
MPKLLVSVIVPAFNAASFIKSALESVLAQTYSQVEVIVVDDGSTDATPSIVRELGDRVRYVHQPNAGPAAARNTGIRNSTGELLAFLDADDVWRLDKLEKQVALISRNPDLGLVYSSLEEIDSHGVSRGYLKAKLRGMVLSEVLLGKGGAGMGSTGLIPRSVAERVGNFDERLPPCEDTDLLWRIAARYPIDYVDEPLAKYRIHSSNAHANLPRMRKAWTLLYAKALADPSVRALGVRFRARCYGRLYTMLAGDHAHAGEPLWALGYACRAILAWPPSLGRMLRRLGRPSRRESAICLPRRLLYIAYWGLREPLGQSLVLPSVKELVRRGFAVTLLTFEKPQDLRDSEGILATRRELDDFRVRWRPLRYHKRPTLPATGFDVLQGVFVGLLESWRRRPDLIHARTFIGGVVGLVLRSFLAVPMVYHNEGFWPDQQVEGGFWPRAGFLYRFTKAIERQLYQRADALVLLSHRSQPVVESFPRVRRRQLPIAVVPSVVDLARFDCPATRSHGDWITLVYAGSLGGRYPVEPLGLFLQALGAQGCRARLRVLSQSDAEMIGASLAATGAPRESWDISRVPHSQMPAELCSADAGLFFLKGGIGAESCSPTKVGEYWACGLPVVMSPGIGDLDDLVRERRVGVLVPDSSRAALEKGARDLLSLLRDPEVSRRCRQVAKDFYALSLGIDAQCALYDKLLGEAGADAP